MCGLPAELSYDEQVQLFFNIDKIRWLKIDDRAQAIRIANGTLGPPEYYQAITGDIKAGADAMGRQMLLKMMGG